MSDQTYDNICTGDTRCSAQGKLEQQNAMAHQQLALCNAGALFAQRAQMHHLRSRAPLHPAFICGTAECNSCGLQKKKGNRALALCRIHRGQLCACRLPVLRAVLTETAGRMVSAGGLRAMFLRARIALEVTVHQALATNSNDLAKIFWLAYRQPLCSVISITGANWAQAFAPLMQTGGCWPHLN